MQLVSTSVKYSSRSTRGVYISSLKFDIKMENMRGVLKPTFSVWIFLDRVQWGKSWQSLHFPRPTICVFRTALVTRNRVVLWIGEAYDANNCDAEHKCFYFKAQFSSKLINFRAGKTISLFTRVFNDAETTNEKKYRQQRSSLTHTNGVTSLKSKLFSCYLTV